MKTLYYKLINFILFVFLPLYCFSQSDSIDGVYAGSDKKTIIIENNRFKILSDGYNIERDKNGSIIEFEDSIVAFGEIKILSDNFIEMNSDNYHKIVGESIIIQEYQDTTIKDSLLIQFSFPLSLEYKIEVYTGLAIKGTFVYELTKNQSEIAIPLEELADIAPCMDFRILKANISPKTFAELKTGSYHRLIAFNYVDDYYTIKNDNTNRISISIPELTNHFFQYYFIKGEYARIDEYGLWWRGNYYEKKV